MKPDIYILVKNRHFYCCVTPVLFALTLGIISASISYIATIKSALTGEVMRGRASKIFVITTFIRRSQ